MTGNGAFDKSRMPSRHTTVGPERAPHRRSSTPWA